MHALFVVVAVHLLNARARTNKNWPFAIENMKSSLVMLTNCITTATSIGHHHRTDCRIVKRNHISTQKNFTWQVSPAAESEHTNILLFYQMVYCKLCWFAARIRSTTSVRRRPLVWTVEWTRAERWACVRVLSAFGYFHPYRTHTFYRIRMAKSMGGVGESTLNDSISDVCCVRLSSSLVLPSEPTLCVGQAAVTLISPKWAIHSFIHFLCSRAPFSFSLFSRPFHAFSHVRSSFIVRVSHSGSGRGQCPSKWPWSFHWWQHSLYLFIHFLVGRALFRLESRCFTQ